MLPLHMGMIVLQVALRNPGWFYTVQAGKLGGDIWVGVGRGFLVGAGWLVYGRVPSFKDSF